MPNNAELLERVTSRPDVLGGKPIIRDMRIPVEFVLSLLSQGVTQDEVLDDYPKLEPEDIRACIAYAHTVIAGDSLAPVSVTTSERGVLEEEAIERLVCPVCGSA